MFESLFGKIKTKNISPQEARKRLSTEKNIVLLDVRTSEEYKEVHIPHSISLPLNQLKSEISNIVKDKNSEIIVYCLSGMRASQACRQMASMGYANVSNMGGIQGWKYETERG